MPSIRHVSAANQRMDSGKRPVFAMQRGSSLPLDMSEIVSSLPNLSQQQTNNNQVQNKWSVPVHATSNINIQMLMQQQENNHKTDIYLQPLPTTLQRSLSNTSSNGSRPSSPAIQRVNSRPSSPAIQRAASIEHQRAATPPLLQRNLSNSSSNGYRTSTLQRSLSNTSSNDQRSSQAPDSPVVMPKQYLFSKFNKAESDHDHDSVLMSSSLDDSQDSQSLMSYSTNSSGNLEVDSACSVDGERHPVSMDRVAVVCEGNSVVMLHMSCDAESTAQSERFTQLLTDVAKACLHYYKRKDSEKSSMNPTHIGQLVMPDRRPVKEHLKEFNDKTSDHVTIVRAAARKVTDRQFVGSYISEPSKKEPRCQIGKSGVLLCLRMLNKIAPVSEFCDQLCHHIVAARPEVVGKPEVPKPGGVSRKEKKQQKPRQLLSQQFLYDPSITVTEAARRSLVEVTDFVLFG